MEKAERLINAKAAQMSKRNKKEARYDMCVSILRYFFVFVLIYPLKDEDFLVNLH
ncbi:hypothetical protein PALB_790 [Pseudoalteromonas luteoviolacea B = ATCC 29581]|nr:hypothetical protein PALB_790 [Pseudoalteromonas luteoviolacea B = ATCC 29581]